MAEVAPEPGIRSPGEPAGTSPFLRRLAFWYAAAVVLLAVALAVGLSERGVDAAGGQISLPVHEVIDNHAVYVQEHRLFVVAIDDDVFVALRGDAKHLPGEGVIMCRPGRYFLDWQHGSLWDESGAYLAGPARADLDLYPSEVVGDEVVIDLSEVLVRDIRSDAPPTPTGSFDTCPPFPSHPGFAVEPGT